MSQSTARVRSVRKLDILRDMADDWFWLESVLAAWTARLPLQGAKPTSA